MPVLGASLALSILSACGGGDNAAAAPDPVVRATTFGSVQGSNDAASGTYSWKGIPFAQPPVADLRFAGPAQARPWDGVREALAFGPPPPQQAAFGMDQGTAGEDWLTLNVWSPDPSRQTRRRRSG